MIEAVLTDPTRTGVVVRGSAGVGKSRVAREALAGMAARGWEVRWVVGTASARALPLGALASWAESGGRDTLRLVRDVIAALTSAPSYQPVAVGVDDAYLLDDLSAFALHQIVQRRAAKLVLTIRDGEPVPAGVQDVWRTGQFDRLDLQPLSCDETSALLSATLGGPVEPDAAARLWKLTQGNVLYLRNIVDHEAAAGRLADDRGVWRWFGEPDVPPALVEMIESRVGALPRSVSDVLDALAVEEPLELAMLTRITDPAAVEEADERGLITVEPGHDRVQVRLAHPLYGEVRRRRAPATRLRRLRGLIAAELAAAEDRDDIRMVVRRAALCLDSDLAPEPDLLVRAAKGAVWLADYALADRLSHAAVRAGAGAEAKLIRAHALTWLGRGQEADEVFAGVDTSVVSDEERAALAFAHASTRLFSLADAQGARALIDAASRTLSPQARGCIDAFFIVYWQAMGKPHAAIRSAANVALDQLPDIVGVQPSLYLVMALGDVGRTSEMASAAQVAHTIVDRSVDAAGMRAIVAAGQVRALLQAGRVSEASEVTERLRKEAASLPGSVQMLTSAVEGRAALGAGRLHTASHLLEGVVEAFASSGDINGLAYVHHLPRTIALAMRGMTDDAVNALAALEDRRHPGYRWLDDELAMARAWVASCRGTVSVAKTIALSAAKTARANGQFAAEVVCLQTATQFGDRSGSARLRELEAMVEGPRVGVAARFATALHAGDGAELASVSEEFERMGDLVAAVDAVAQAAVAYRRQDLRGSALGCSRRAEALAEQCGASTPALRQAVERLPFTDREREIVMLLAHGLSGREIAERLTLSIRTVESHIYRAMTKTGVSSREELAALLGGHPSTPTQRDARAGWARLSSPRAGNPIGGLGRI